MVVAMSATVALLATVVVATASLAALYAARTQAANAADAAALAAAVSTYPPASGTTPLTAAGRAAAANQAVLISCRCPVEAGMLPRTVEVVTAVVVDVPIFGEYQVRGAARAEFDPRRWLGR